jgi:hypothetical protein
MEEVGHNFPVDRPCISAWHAPAIGQEIHGWLIICQSRPDTRLIPTGEDPNIVHRLGARRVIVQGNDTPARFPVPIKDLLAQGTILPGRWQLVDHGFERDRLWFIHLNISHGSSS